MGKRLFDLVVASVLLVLFAPVIGAVAIVVRLSLGSPVLFRQERPGRHCRPFELIKFRTMTDLRDEAGRALPDAARMTRVGSWLRRWSLDELPQLINVVRGDMSLVGPRPLLMEYIPLYTAEQLRRHEVPPGLTGWAQVNGRNNREWSDRLAMDVWYVDNRTFWLDLKILWLTVIKVLKAEGVTQSGHATVERFTGSKS